MSSENHRGQWEGKNVNLGGRTLKLRHYYPDSREYVAVDKRTMEYCLVAVDLLTDGMGVTWLEDDPPRPPVTFPIDDEGVSL